MPPRSLRILSPMSDQILLATKKGTLLIDRKHGRWTPRPISHAGQAVSYAARARKRVSDKESGAHFGFPIVARTSDDVIYHHAPDPLGAIRLMPRVSFTQHLNKFFPTLKQAEQVECATVAEVIAALEKRYPGFALYVADETGRARDEASLPRQVHR